MKWIEKLIAASALLIAAIPVCALISLAIFATLHDLTYHTARTLCVIFFLALVALALRAARH